METVKSIHAWMVEKIATYPAVTLYVWAGSLVGMIILMWG